MSTQPGKDPFTLTRWILQEQKKYPNAKGDLTIILNSIALACKIISSAASAAGIHSLEGFAGGQNKSGDVVKKLDVFSNDCMINTLRWSGKVPIMVSEENDEPIEVKCDDPKYAVMFDPLDGSSNIDANVSVGTIFGIARIRDQKNPNIKDCLQIGDDYVCAGYTMYGDATLLVLTFGDVVNGFTLDPQIGEFILTHRNIRIPKVGNVFSCNEGSALSWDPVMREYIRKCKLPQPATGKPKKARYIGSMVADVHRTLLYGGIFMYPANKASPHGKLRLLYEGNPMAFIMKAAGGRAILNGKEEILTYVPDKIHCRTPIILGSAQDVTDIETMYREYEKTKKNKKSGVETVDDLIRYLDDAELDTISINDLKQLNK
eukprot:1026909_1